MDIFGLFKKKKPQVKVTPVPRKYTGTGAAVGKALNSSLRKDTADLKGDTDATARRFNAEKTPSSDFKRRIRIMQSRSN